MALAAGVALHLYGRACFSKATAELEALVGEELLFDFTHLETSRLAQKKNAAVRLLDGTKTLDLSDSEQRQISEAWHVARDEWSPELEENIRTLIGRHRDGLEILHEVATIERSSFEIRYREGYAAKLSDQPSTHVTRLLNVEGRLALADGDVESGLAAVGAMARIATILQQEHFFIYLAHALGAERSLNRLVFEVLEETEPWAAAPALLAELENLLPTWDWQERALEFLVIEGSMHSVAFRKDVATPWLVRCLFGRLVGAESLVGTRKSAELISLPYGRAQDRFDAASGSSVLELGPIYDHWHFGQAPLQPEFEPLTPFGSLVTLAQLLAALPLSAAPDFSANSRGRLIGFYVKIQVIAAERHLLRAALALRRGGIVHGRYPSERPASAILAKPSPFTGQLIAYRLGEDGSLALELEGATTLLAEWWGGRSWTKEKETRDAVNSWLRDKVFAVTLPPPSQLMGARGWPRARASTIGTISTTGISPRSTEPESSFSIRRLGGHEGRFGGGAPVNGGRPLAQRSIRAYTMA